MKDERNTRMGGSHAARKARWTRRTARVLRAKERKEFLDSLTPVEREAHIWNNKVAYNKAHNLPAPVKEVLHV